MLLDRTVRDLLGEFGSSRPTPGGGSAAALASALGASLLLMVASLPRTRTGSDEDRVALTTATGALTDLRDRLADAVELDAAAYDDVVAARRMPKGSVDEEAARADALQRALVTATDVPLAVMRHTLAVLKHAQLVAAHAHRAAASDVDVALLLLQAGFKGARLNVEANLETVKDEAYRYETSAEVGRLAAAAGL
jgi:methenyltetrahydrofolate cyclohydrolase